LQRNGGGELRRASLHANGLRRRASGAIGAALDAFDDEAAQEREELRQERKRERERERRMESRDGKRSKSGREEERDVSERIALGQAVPTSSETLYDQRLFNQSEGVASGFSGGDDAYNIYDKALFRGGSASEAIYRPTRTTEDGWGDEDAAVDKVTKASRFAPGDRGFDGAGGGAAAESGGRGRPVEFEQESAADPFGLDEFLSEAKRGKALDGIGESSGGMGASAGGAMDGGGSGRSSLQFRKGGA